MITRRSGSEGYVLFQVIVVIAVLAIAIVVAARVQAGASRSLRALQETTAQDIAAHTITARVAFLLLTEPVGSRSVNVGGAREARAPSPDAMGARLTSARGLRQEALYLDGRYYQAGVQETFVALQDEAGLLNLNAGDDAALAGVIEGLGASRQTARGLAAILNDYVDEDDLSRAYGAEKDAYRRAGLPDPENRPLQTAWAASRALGWGSALTDRQLERLWSLTSAPAKGKALNVNTAPRAVLESVLGDVRVARTLIAQRERSPLENLDDVQGLAGVRTRADGVVLATRPGATFRVVIAFGSSPETARQRIEGQLTLADAGADRPIYWSNVRRAHAPSGGWEGRERGNGSERVPDSPALLAP